MDKTATNIFLLLMNDLSPLNSKYNYSIQTKSISNVVDILLDEVESFVHKIGNKISEFSASEEILQLINCIKSKKQLRSGKKIFNMCLHDRTILLGLEYLLFSTKNVPHAVKEEKTLTENFENDIEGWNMNRHYDATLLVPFGVDDLLLCVSPQLLPAILSLKMLRSMTEIQLQKFSFSAKVFQQDSGFEDLQYLLRPNIKHENIVLFEQTSNKKLNDNIRSTEQLNLISSYGIFELKLPTFSVKKHENKIHFQHLKTSNNEKSDVMKLLHHKWLLDLEMQFCTLKKHICVFANSFLKTAFPGTHNLPEIMDTSISLIPLKNKLAHKILSHVECLSKIVSGHDENGKERVEATSNSYIDIINELKVTREIVLDVVSALTTPMKKRLNWLKLKYKLASEEVVHLSSITDEQNKEFGELEDMKRKLVDSLLTIEKEKSSPHFKKTRVLKLINHSDDIQDIILGHVNKEKEENIIRIKLTENSLYELIHNLMIQFDKLENQLLLLQDSSFKKNDESVNSIFFDEKFSDIETLGSKISRIGFEDFIRQNKISQSQNFMNPTKSAIISMEKRENYRKRIEGKALLNQKVFFSFS
jgi:hypothetical protein